MPAPDPGPLQLARWPIAAGLTVDLVRYPEGWSYAPHHHSTFDVSLVLRGEIEERAGSRASRAGSLMAVAKPAGFEHADRFARTTEILRLRVDPATAGPVFEERLDAADAAWSHSPAITRALLRLAHGAVAAPEGERAAADLENLAIDLLAAIRGARRPRSCGPAWLVRVEQAVRDRCAEPLRVSELARGEGLHPVYLSRVFRQVHGVSPQRFIARCRLEGAVDSARSTRRSLADIAAEHGFADQAHLCRIARRLTSLSPSALRSLGDRRAPR